MGFNVTVFEKTGRIGGRTLTTNVFGDELQPVEVGASIFAAVNTILVNATETFGLDRTGLREGNPGDVTAIWDGRRIVYETVEDQSAWWDAAKLVWRYGLSPYRTSTLVKRVVGKFLKLYEEPRFPFRSLTQRAYELDLAAATGVTGEQLLASNGVSPEFARDIVQAATRVNYASDLTYLHGLDTMVSLAATGASAVAGGNWQIFERMVLHSGAALQLNTTVTSIHAKGHTDASSGSSKKYTVRTDAEDDDYPITFDKVVLATPWQFGGIDADGSVLRHKIDTVNYTKLHVTLLTTPYRLRPEFFGLDPGTPSGSSGWKTPSTVYTTLPEGEKPNAEGGAGSPGFFSVSNLRTVVNPHTGRREFLYKIFSPEVVQTSFLEDLFGVDIPDPTTELAADGPISWYYPTSFYAYPRALPRVTFQDPVVGDGVFYTSGMEGFISTMETNALMGRNVARLIVDDELSGNGGQKAKGTGENDEL